jgi:hypothetical protein
VIEIEMLPLWYSIGQKFHADEEITLKFQFLTVGGPLAYGHDPKS